MPRDVRWILSGEGLDGWSCIIEKLFYLLVSKSWHVYFLLIFNVNLFKIKKKERKKSPELHKHLHA
jgi:hypothetical protein